MKVRLRWLWIRRLVVVAALVLSLAWLFVLLLLPAVVRGRITSALERAGIDDATFHQQSVTLSQWHGSDIRFGSDPWLSIGSLNAEYDLGSLLNGRVDSVEISGAEWVVEIRDGEIVWLPVKPTRDGALNLSDLPFRHAHLHGCAIIVRHEGAEDRILIDGSLRNEGESGPTFNLRVNGLGRTLLVTGSAANTDGRLELRLAAKSASGSASEAVQAEMGFVQASERNPGTLSVQLKTGSLPLRVGDWNAAVSGLDSDVDVEFDQAWNPINATGSVSVADVSAAGFGVEDVKLSLLQEGDRPIVDLSGEWGSWRLDSLRGDLREIIAMARGDADSPVVLHLHATGKPPETLLQRIQEQYGAEVSLQNPLALTGDAELSLDSQSSRQWSLLMSAAAVNVPRMDVLLKDQQIELRGVQCDLQVRAEVNAESVTVNALEGSELHLESVAMGRPDAAVRSTETHLGITTDSDQPLIQLTRHSGGDLWDVRSSVGIAALAPVSFSGAGMEGSAEQLGSTVSLALGADRRLSLQAGIDVRNTRVSIPDWNVVADGVDLTLPIQVNAATATDDDSIPPPGEFAIRSISLGEETLPELKGTVRWVDSRAELGATWPVVDGGTLTASGWVERVEGAWRGEVDAELPRTELTETSGLERLKALGDVRLGGALAMDAHVELQDGELRPLVNFSGEHIMITHPNTALSIEDADIALTIDGLQPLGSPGGQRITIHKAMLGEVPINDGEIRFQVEAVDSILVESAKWTMGNAGRFSATAMRIDPRHPRISTDVFCEDVQLRYWLGLLSGERATGEGRLNGKLAVTWDPSTRQRFTFGEGYLYAQPGRGVLQASDVTALEQKLDADMPQFRTDKGLAQVKRRLLEALTDFEYSMFRIDFIPTDNELMAETLISGKGRQGANAQEIGELRILLREFDVLLRQLLLGKELFDRIGGPEDDEGGGFFDE